MKGKVLFFGKIDDPQAAPEKWLAEKAELLAGRAPRVRDHSGLSLRELANRFLTYKRERGVSGELSERTWAEYHATCARLLTTFTQDFPVGSLIIDDFDKAPFRDREAMGADPARQ